MRILGIGDYLSLGDLYLRLSRQGHAVRVYVQEIEAHGIFAGMLDRVSDWRTQLDWIREAGSEGCIVFESAAKGALQDQLRRDGLRVIGGSAWGDRIENDRAYGQEVMRAHGLRTAAVHEFAAFDEALAFLRRHPGRYVYKLSDDTAASTRNYVGQMADGADMAAVLKLEQRRCAAAAPRFILMQHLSGIEVGVGAYFNGETFLSPPLLDWEHKRLFPGDLGELTGEMGTVVTYRGAQRLFEQTLARIEAPLRASGYCGYINLNTIVNQDGIWPLEFTCRFGYPGFAICDALHAESWDRIFSKLLDRSSTQVETHPGFAVGVVLTVPPFPYEYGYSELSKGAPIFFQTPLSEAEHQHLHFGEVALKGAQLVTSGSLGYVMVVTGRGAAIAEAQEAAYALARKIVVPNLRYRTDIGERLRLKDYAALSALGLIDENSAR